MNKHQQHTLWAMAIAAVMLAVIAGSVWNWYQRLPQPVETPNEQTQVENAALSFVKTLAAYQDLGKPTLLLEKSEIVEPGMWVEQLRTDAASGAQQQYVIEVQNGHVIHHQITVIDATGELMAYAPEPDSVIAQLPLSVTGKAKPGSQLSLNLLAGGSNNLLQSKQTFADPTIGEYAESFDAIPAGDYQLSIQSSTSSVTIPFTVQ